MHDPLLQKCPECGKMELYQDLTGQHTFVYQDPKTLGHLAERNTARAGGYELESIRKPNKKKTKPPVPWYNNEGKDLKKSLSHLDTPEKKQNYIFHGK